MSFNHQDGGSSASHSSRQGSPYGEQPLTSQASASSSTSDLAGEQPFGHGSRSYQLAQAAPRGHVGSSFFNSRARGTGSLGYRGRGRGGRGNGGRGRGGRHSPGLDRSLFIIPANIHSARGAYMHLESIPDATTAWDIYSTLSRHGSIVYIDLDDTRRKTSQRSARIKFVPPPADFSFIVNGRCAIVLQKDASFYEHWTQISFGQLSKEDRKILTPNRRECVPLRSMPLSRLAIGLFTTPDTILGKKYLESSGHGDSLKLTVDFKRQVIELNLVMTALAGTSSLEATFRLEIQFDRLSASKLTPKKLFRTKTGEKSWAVVISLDDPPRVYKRRTEMSSSFWPGDLQWTDRDAWLRAIELTAEQPQARGVVSLDEACPGIKVGSWKTFWIPLDDKQMDEWLEIESSLADWNIKTTTDLTLSLINGEATKPAVWDLLEGAEEPLAEITDETSWSTDLALFISPSAKTAIRLPFDVRYQLEVCISLGIISEYNISREFLEKLSQTANSPAKFYDDERARLVLEYAADQGKRIWNPMDLFQDPAAMTYFPTSWKTPEYCALVRKVTVTPTTMYFNTPIVETSNRVIRHYKHLQQYFLRVQFTDERPDGRIQGSDYERDNEIYAHCFTVLHQGIRMGRWHWKFLAFGNSQIRENSVYFFCENQDGGPSCNDMRAWMGQFTHITVIAKYAARLGQCFSTTRLCRGMSQLKLVKIDDVQRHNCCFTDGVGKISFFLASMVTQDWGLDEQPSAFQFRMGGCKGVLVAWNDVQRSEVHIRKSQEKFLAVFNGLEIVKCSGFANATLNRQTITILSTLGVPDGVFCDLMEAQLKGYNAALTNKAKAVELLEKFIDENQMTLSIAQMVRDGFMDAQEPFVQTLLRLWRTWSVKALRDKARIAVDDGAFVLGCVDETGTLRGHDMRIEGLTTVRQDQLPQVFLQIPNKAEDGGKAHSYRVITGLCLVGRNPSLHPGDIRVVEAVDVPALRHIRNVLVFPLKGDRDVPGMLSGGDLDGDDFFAIWDQRLLPPQHRWGTPPMDYTPPKPKEESGGVTAEHLKSFFVLYMKNNQLGLIAHAHLGTADYEDQGAFHEKCLKLAQLHSRAVDYVKTGVPAVFDRKELSPSQWPHFMEKRKRGYHSTTALGQLFDMARAQDLRFKASYEEPFDSRILNRYKLDAEMLKKARQIKTQYDTAMRRVMGQMEIETEFEVFTTFSLAKPRFSSEYKMQERLLHESTTVKQVFRGLCREAVDDSRDLENLGPFVAAMYTVTYEEVRIALHEAHHPQIGQNGRIRYRRVTPRSMPLISFPWLFADVLGKIARGDDQTSDPFTQNCSERAPERPSKASSTQTCAGDQAFMPVANAIMEAMEKPDYMVTAEGLIIHRGEVLNFFDHDSEDEYTQPTNQSDSLNEDPIDSQINSQADNQTQDYLSENQIALAQLDKSGEDCSRMETMPEAAGEPAAAALSAPDRALASLLIEEPDEREEAADDAERSDLGTSDRDEEDEGDEVAIDLNLDEDDPTALEKVVNMLAAPSI